MTDSILTNTKKVLGIDESYKAFDADVLMHINSVFAIMNQLGLGPDVGMVVEDETDTWSSFYDDPRLSSIKTYVYLRVRMLFDPPETSYHQTSMENQIQELGWRLTAAVETPT